jgi:multidrug efflux pump subunit AcrA (membrane-fusion protein)
MTSEANVDILFGGQSDAHFQGKVARTARALDPQSRTLRVEIDLPNARHALVPGMFVQARFALDGGGRVQVPAAALMFRSQGPQVAVVDDKGAVAFRPVTIASDDGATVTIGSGIEAGEAIALNLSSQIASGQIIKPNRIGDTRSASSAQ